LGARKNNVTKKNKGERDKLRRGKRSGKKRAEPFIRKIEGKHGERKRGRKKMSRSFPDAKRQKKNL